MRLTTATLLPLAWRLVSPKAIIAATSALVRYCFAAHSGAYGKGRWHMHHLDYICIKLG